MCFSLYLIVGKSLQIPRRPVPFLILRSGGDDDKCDYYGLDYDDDNYFCHLVGNITKCNFQCVGERIAVKESLE